MASNEADTCRRHVTPKLQGAKWDTSLHSLNERRILRTTLTTRLGLTCLDVGHIDPLFDVVLTKCPS